MANALDLAGTGYVNCGRVSSVDNIQTKTIVILYRGGSVSSNNIFVTKRQSSGGASGWDIGVNGDAERYTSTQIYDPSAILYASPFGSLRNTTSTWHWLFCVMNLSAGVGSQHRYYTCNFGSSLVDIGVNVASIDGSGSLIDDSSNSIIIGGSPTLVPSCNTAVAFVGQIDSALSLSSAQIVVDSMATANWSYAVRLGWDGSATAPDATNTLTPVVSGTTSLITTAPDYWTGVPVSSPTFPKGFRPFARLR